MHTKTSTINNYYIDCFLSRTICFPSKLFLVNSKLSSLLKVGKQRGEVVTSRRHGSKNVGWQQTKDPLSKIIRNVSSFIGLIQFHLICQKLPWFSAVESERTVSKIREKKENFCVVFTVSMKRERKIRVLCRSHAKTAKKRDVHAKLSFC